jgi:hypothetical protein
VSFSAGELDVLMQTELKIGLELPPNRQFKTLWATLPDEAQERVHIALLHYRSSYEPWIKYKSVEQENREAHWLIGVRLLNASWLNKPFAAQWRVMDPLEKRLLRFLLVVDLIQDAGRWREEQRHRRRVQGLTVRK